MQHIKQIGPLLVWYAKNTTAEIHYKNVQWVSSLRKAVGFTLKYWMHVRAETICLSSNISISVTKNIIRYKLNNYLRNVGNGCLYHSSPLSNRHMAFRIHIIMGFYMINKFFNLQIYISISYCSTQDKHNEAQKSQFMNEMYNVKIV